MYSEILNSTFVDLPLKSFLFSEMTITLDHDHVKAENCDKDKKELEDQNAIVSDPGSPETGITLATLEQLNPNESVTVLLDVVTKDEDTSNAAECPKVEDLIAFLEKRIPKIHLDPPSSKLQSTISRDLILARQDPRKIYTHPVAITETTDSSKSKDKAEIKVSAVTKLSESSGMDIKIQNNFQTTSSSVEETINNCFLGKIIHHG